MHPATLQAIDRVQQGAPDGAASPEMLVARMIAELVSQNDQIRRLIQNPGSTMLLDDDGTIFFDNVDPTKRAKFQLSGLTTGVTRVVTLPDADATLLGEATTQTITNKNIAASQLTGNIDVARLSNALTAPGAIGGTTPAAVAGTAITGTDLDISTGTKTASNPVSFTQTWNSSGVAFCALSVAVTATASADLSKVVDFTFGSDFYARFEKNTAIGSAAGIWAVGGTGAMMAVRAAAETTPRVLLYANGLKLASSSFVHWTANSTNADTTAVLGLYREDSTTLTLCDGGTLSNYRDLKMRRLKVDATMTAAGTTGARTIDKGAGSVNFAAGATSLVVTNNLVTTSSIILAMVDAGSAVNVQRIVAASGSFTIYLNTTAASEVAVKWAVIN